MTLLSDELFYMEQAISLAKKVNVRAVSPNPRVGAVIVREREIIGKGWHKGPGTDHAEIMAIKEAAKNGRSVEGSDLYVTLEPCCHEGGGKCTPPCTGAIIKAEISAVFAGMEDPNPAVAGKGLQKLREAGIRVECGMARDKAEQLNPWYIHAMKEGRPWVILKAAQTLDGFIADHDGVSKWITSPGPRREVHKLRGEADAVLVGAGTFRTDNPRLNVRDLPSGGETGLFQPRPVILGSGKDFPEQHFLMNSPERRPVLAFKRPASDSPEHEKLKNKMEERGFTLVPFSELSELLRKLKSEGIHSLLVEGGHRTFSGFLEEDLVDEITIHTAPRLLGKGIPGISGFGAGKLERTVEFSSIQWAILDSHAIFRGQIERRA